MTDRDVSAYRDCLRIWKRERRLCCAALLSGDPKLVSRYLENERRLHKNVIYPLMMARSNDQKIAYVPETVWFNLHEAVEINVGLYQEKGIWQFAAWMNRVYPEDRNGSFYSASDKFVLLSEDEDRH